MSDKLGPMTFGKKEEQIFLGRDFTQLQDYSEHTAVEIDAEVRRIIQDCYQQAKDLLASNVEVLHKIAEALLDKEVLDGAEIDEVIRAVGRANGSTPLTAAGADVRA
jgi:cell division protease FtsH